MKFAIRRLLAGAITAPLPVLAYALLIIYLDTALGYPTREMFRMVQSNALDIIFVWLLVWLALPALVKFIKE